jgi:hypothetical protein
VINITLLFQLLFQLLLDQLFLTMPTDPTQEWDGRTHPTQEWDGRTHPTQEWDGRTHPTQEWDGPAQIIITQPQLEFEEKSTDIIYMGPITRRHSTIDTLPQENTCLCGDCCCCCMYVCKCCL